ncbi:hypothetical protein HYX06_00675 [Candidatus Woesearchaeota archaeon]|nr:hypothetical protein [Candidatus Woesearchaeota archaeon]
MQNKPRKMELWMILIAAAIAVVGFYFLGPSITGFVIKEAGYEKDVNLVITSNGNYTLSLDNIGELKSLKIDGRVTSYGKARVYIEQDGTRHLVFDSSRLGEGEVSSNESNLITGFAAKEDEKGKNDSESDEDKKEKNKKPEWKGDGEFIVNGTAEINLSQYFTDEDNDELAYSVSDAEGVDASIDDAVVTIEPISEDNFNTTITFIASDGIGSKSHTVKLIVIAENPDALPINETINQTPEINGTIPIINETNETINATIPINETIPLNQTINETAITNETIDKEIAINLAYNSGTVYDANDNGEESVNGVVDLSVAGTSFNWEADDSKLCARWEAYNSEESVLTKFCNGNSDCCSFVGLLPTQQNWSDVYYSTYGKDGAGHENIVSAQVIYYDVNLSPDNLKSEIYNSGWGNLSVKFFEEEIEFFDECLETCSLAGLNKSGYTLVFEIEDDAVLRIDRIKYSLLTDVENNAPSLLQNITLVNVSRNKNSTINLSRYFADQDGDKLQYNYYAADNITILFDNDIATIVPDRGVEGIRYSYFIANDSDLAAVSDVFMINVSQEKFRPKVEIGKAVKWQQVILVDTTNTTSVNLSLPETASNLTITILNETVQNEVADEKIKVFEDGELKDKDNFEAGKSLDKVRREIGILEEARAKKSSKVSVEGGEFRDSEIDSKLNDLRGEESELEQQLDDASGGNLITGNLFAAITGNVIALTETTLNETQPILVINESLAKNIEITIQYETEAPIAIENEINAYTKQVKIVSETSYEDVLSYTSLNDVPQSSIKLYWLQDDEKILFDNVNYYDENNNGLIDKIEWIVPHLSNQTFEVSIGILNVQSYPTVFGNWTVGFNTSGTGNLSIYGYNGTSYSEVPDDSSTINDLEYLETRCGDAVVNTTVVCSNGEEMPYEVYKIKKRIAEIKKRLNELNQTG